MPTPTTTDVIYSDILLNFDIHPVKQDLVRAINEAAVKRALRNLLMTRKGERFFNYSLGSGLHQFLFEPMTPQTTTAIKNAVESTINNFEPRVRLVGVKVTPIEEANHYDVAITFYIINRPDPITFNVSLERTR